MKKLIYFFVMVIIAGCKEKYDLPVTSPASGYLVIEGLINSGGDSTYIELSRTNKVNSGQKEHENGAIVNVEGNDNSNGRLVEIIPGIYSSRLTLNDTKQYRLRIKTRDGKEYLSDFVQVKNTPPIDSISWRSENTGVRFYFNTHDPQNNTRYYLWDYEETWEFHSAFISLLKYSFNSSGVPHVGFKDSVHFSHDTLIFKCWNSVISSNILLGSSARLSSDVISMLPFLFIPAGSKKISVLYSVNVRQYALTKEGYEFLEKMKKNTEENGSIFDPQPSQLKGNIHCVTDPLEPVIGYINVSTVSSKRLFIYNNQLPSWNYRNSCEEVAVKNNPDSIAEAIRSGLVPTVPLPPFGIGIVYFGGTSLGCLDCTQSGTNKRPPFWP